jgi:DNA-binding transcriptional LysR family regulator
VNDAYETFVQIVEQQTLVKAAATLHVTQPTVTRQLQQLEATLGMALFDRTGKRLALNHAGELVYRYAKTYLALQQKMCDELNGFGNPEEGHIYLGAGLTPSIYLLPQVLASYRELHPRVQFQVRSGSSREICDLLLQREVDLGIVTTFAQSHSELAGVPLYRDDLLLVAAPSSPLAQGAAVLFAELGAHPFVLMRQGSGLRSMVIELATRRGLNIVIAMETDSLESISRLVQHGVGLSFLPRSSAQDDVHAGKLVVVPVADVELGARTISLISRTDSLLPACTAQFAAALPQLLNASNPSD